MVGEGRGLSPGANAEVGEGRTSRRRLPDGLDEKLFVFQANEDVPGREWGKSNDGVEGCGSANDVEGSEFLRLG